jgi:hypothetical protein
MICWMNKMVNIDYDVKSFVTDAADIEVELKDKGLDSKITKDKVRAYLRRVFKKCVFCEIKGNHDIEHYRPKGAVTTLKYDENEKIYKTVVVKDEDGVDHPGYKWLTNEITNFLWVCRDCNAGKGGKHNKFPLNVKGQRVFTHSEPENRRALRIDSNILTQEKPLLLNPFIHFSEDHLKINYFGKLIPVNNSEEGEITIEVCNLNRYSLLIERRKRIIDEFFHKLIFQVIRLIGIMRLLVEYLGNIDYKIIKVLYALSFEGLFSEIEKNKERDSEFSRVYHCIYFEFEEILDKYLKKIFSVPDDKEDNKKDANRLVRKILLDSFNMLTQNASGPLK